MAERLSDKLNEFLETCQGKDVSLDYLRRELRIEPASRAYGELRVLMHNLAEKKTVRASGRKDGVYKVVRQVNRIKVFGVQREDRPPFKLLFPYDFDRSMELFFAEDIIIREGDLVSIGGQSNLGKTTLALGFCGANIDRLPILMGNEYTTRIGDTDDFEPTPRFLNRLNNMDWVEWTDESGQDKFTLLPVREDYAEHIVKDKINIIDWINLDADRLYDISRVMDSIKAELGRGVGIPVLQKGEGSMARGGQFTKDFTDCELLIDRFNEYESLLTIGKVKEYTKPVMGRKFAFGIHQGVKIISISDVNTTYIFGQLPFHLYCYALRIEIGEKLICNLALIPPTPTFAKKDIYYPFPNLFLLVHFYTPPLLLLIS